MHPDDGELWKLLSVALKRQRKDALATLRRSRDLMPQDAEAHRNLGAALIVLMSMKRMPRVARRAVAQAWRNGRKAHWFQDQDYEALLPQPLAEVRRALNIADPSLYRAVMA